MTRFEKFTERARQVVTLAQEEARNLQHDFIGTEHLLLGLIREGKGVAAQVLTGQGVELLKARSEIERIVGRGKETTIGELSLTPRSKKVIELAVDEARRLQHDYIGTEHVLLGLIREGEGVAASVLESFGISPETVRQKVIALLGKVDSPTIQVPLPHPASLLLRKGQRWLAKQRKRSTVRSKIGLDYCCSFCGKPRNKVERLISGPGHVYICNECVELCKNIIDGRKEN